MKFKSDQYCLTILNEPAYLNNSVQNQTNDRIYNLDPEFQASSSYRVSCNPGSTSCCILASAGATTAGENSAIIHESACWIAIGDQVIKLSLPSLDIFWNKSLDDATCFAIYETPCKTGIIVHGELTVTRISYEGNIIWKALGRDIFSGCFSMKDKYVEVEDFNEDVYRFSMVDGTAL